MNTLALNAGLAATVIVLWNSIWLQRKTRRANERRIHAHGTFFCNAAAVVYLVDADG